MMNFHKKSHEVPGLNTSSLPDLIFSVLFFFMIVTHMRQVTLKVDCRFLRQGTHPPDQEIGGEPYLYR